MIFFLIFLIISILLTLAQPKLIEWAIDNGISTGVVNNIITGAVGILLLGIIGNLSNLISGYLLIKSSQGMGHELRGSLFKKIVSFSFINFDKWRTGELMVRLNSDVNTVRMFVRMGLLMLVQSLLWIIGSVFFMFLTDIHLASIMAVIMGGTFIFSITFITSNECL